MPVKTGIVLTEEQTHVVRSLMRFEKQVQSLGGYAGTGKSTIVARLKALLPTFAVCAYTGKAASILRRKGIEAQTIHSLIYKPCEEEWWDEELEKMMFRRYFQLLLPHQLDCQGFIVDEASMVGENIHEHLLTFNRPIIYVGDHGQLPPVMGGVLNFMRNPDYRLETLHRNAGEIARFAEWLRHGRPADAWRAQGKVRLTYDRGPIWSADQVIVAFNATRVGLNRTARQNLGYPEDQPIVGDKIMCLANNSKLCIFNGMQGVIEEINTYELTFRNNEVRVRVPYNLRSFNLENQQELKNEKIDWVPFDYCYAITAHKCVHPDTLLETDEGLIPISDLADTGVVATPDGPKSYRNLVGNGEGLAIRIVTDHGYEITVTPEHRVEVWDGMEYTMTTADQLTTGQYVRLKMGHTIEPIRTDLPIMGVGDVRAKTIRQPEFNNDLAEFFGLMVADGTVFKSGFRLAKRHHDVIQRFEYLCDSLFNCRPRRVVVGGTAAIEVSSTIMVDWLKRVDGMNPNEKMVPNCILRSPLPIQRAFLRGLMEDGTVGVMRDGGFNYVQFTSHVKHLLDTVRVMLLRMGITTSTGKNSLYIYGTSGVKFREQIGFVSRFKNERLLLCSPSERWSVLPVSKKESEVLKPYLKAGDWYNLRSRGYISRLKAPSLPFLVDRLAYYHDKIATIEVTFCPSMCIEVPDGHRFLQNGFPFWNSQGDEWPHVAVIEQRCKGWDHKCWAYTAASRAKESVLWVC